MTPASRLREAASSPPNREGLSPLGLTERDCLRWPLNAHAGLSAKQLPAYRAARVLDDLRQGSRRSRSLVYGVLHGLVLPVWRGMGSRPRRALSRLGGATVVTGGAGPACGHARAVCVSASPTSGWPTRRNRSWRSRTPAVRSTRSRRPRMNRAVARQAEAKRETVARVINAEREIPCPPRSGMPPMS